MPVALASRWHHTLTRACVDNRPIRLCHFLFVLQLSLNSSLIAHNCCSEWKNSFSALGIQSSEEWQPQHHKLLKMVSSLLTYEAWSDMSKGRVTTHPPIFPLHCPISSWVHSLDLVDSLSLSIPLWVSRGGIPICNSQVTTVPLKGFAVKLKSIFWDERIGDPKPSDNIFPNKSLGIHVLDICQWFSFDPLGEVIRVDQ